MAVPTYGSIMLNEDMTQVISPRSFQSATPTFWEDYSDFLLNHLSLRMNVAFYSTSTLKKYSYQVTVPAMK